MQIWKALAASIRNARGRLRGRAVPGMVEEQHGGLCSWREGCRGENGSGDYRGVSRGQILKGLGHCKDFGFYSGSVGKQESDMIQFTVFVFVNVDIFKGLWNENYGCLVGNEVEAVGEMRKELWPRLSVNA